MATRPEAALAVAVIQSAIADLLDARPVLRARDRESVRRAWYRAREQADAGAFLTGPDTPIRQHWRRLAGLSEDALRRPAWVRRARAHAAYAARLERAYTRAVDRRCGRRGPSQ